MVNINFVTIYILVVIILLFVTNIIYNNDKFNKMLNIIDNSDKFKQISQYSY